MILTEPKADVNGTIVWPLIVGDSAYPLKPWLLCPFKENGALSREQKKFNEELSRAQIVSDHAYGLNKGKMESPTKMVRRRQWQNSRHYNCLLYFG